MVLYPFVDFLLNDPKNFYGASVSQKLRDTGCLLIFDSHLLQKAILGLRLIFDGVFIEKGKCEMDKKMGVSKFPLHGWLEHVFGETKKFEKGREKGNFETR